MVLYPYPFKEERRVLAIVPEDMIDIDFDVLIAHSDLTKDITGLRKKLEKMYPIKSKRTLGLDIQNMIQHHKFGQFYLYNQAQQDFETEVGTTDMPVEKIEANISTILKNVKKDCKSLQPSNKLISNSR